MNIYKNRYFPGFRVLAFISPSPQSPPLKGGEEFGTGLFYAGMTEVVSVVRLTTASPSHRVSASGGFSPNLSLPLRNPAYHAVDKSRHL
jgi:hypothetical protein